MTRLDDALMQAGADLRDRFDGAPTPESHHDRRPTAARAVLAGAVVVLVVLGLVAVVRSARETTPAGRVEEWQRVSMTSAFGPNVVVTQVVDGASGFVAAGSRSHRCRAGAPYSACVTPLLWISVDGVRWTEVKLSAARAALSEVALGERSGTYVAIWENVDGAAVWTSVDGRDWSRSAQLRIPRSSERVQSLIEWRVQGDESGLVASRFGGGGGWSAWTSRTGRRWTRAGGGLTSDVQYGLPGAARLGHSYLAVSPGIHTATNGASGGKPQIMVSRDGARWRPIASNAPERFHPQLEANADHTAVLGIQFRIPGVLSVQPVGLFKTKDGTTWEEVDSFRTQAATASPYALLQTQGWWVISGTTGSGRQRTTLWVSSDLDHWSEMPPAGVGRGAPGQLAAHGRTVVAVPRDGRWIRIWHRPASRG